MSVRNLFTLLLLLWLAPVARATPQTITLAPGWNPVAFQGSRITTLTLPPQVAGAVYYDGTAYQTFTPSPDSLNQGAGLRRGFWFYATAAASLTYDGTMEASGDQLNLRQGWNLVGFPSTLSGTSLSLSQNGQTVPLGNLVLTRFYENGSTAVEMPAGTLRDGRIYWIYANGTATLSWGSSPQPSPQSSPQPTVQASPWGAAVETWQLTGYMVGREAGIDGTDGALVMANVIPRPEGGYRMFYNQTSPTMARIRYADSTDLTRFTAGGTALDGAPDPADRESQVGGASVHRLADGRYRMYYRVCPQPSPGQRAGYSYRSATSTDGATFTREGVRIEIRPYDPASQFELAGHGTVFELPGGGYGCMFSGNLVGDSGPSDLFLATSSDGLSWGNFKLLYDGWHDPVIVRHEGRYYMYANYLTSGSGRAISSDGVNWPSAPDPIAFVDESGATLNFDNNKIGDLGAISTSAGLRLFSNFTKMAGGPSSGIVSFKLKP